MKETEVGLSLSLCSCSLVGGEINGEGALLSTTLVCTVWSCWPFFFFLFFYGFSSCLTGATRPIWFQCSTALRPEQIPAELSTVDFSFLSWTSVCFLVRFETPISEAPFLINRCARFVFSVAACCVNRLIDTFQRDWFQLLTFSPIQCQTQIPTACAAADWIPSVLWFEFFSWFVLCFSGLEPFYPFLDVRADRLVHLVYLFILFCWYAIGNWKEKSRPSCVISHFSPNTTAGLRCSG